VVSATLDRLRLRWPGVGADTSNCPLWLADIEVAVEFVVAVHDGRFRTPGDWNGSASFWDRIR
jgi:hypothetical protein